MKCGAKKRDGTPCRAPAMENGRCRIHGGKSPKGINSPAYRHGLYSKYAGDSLKKILNELEGVKSQDLIKPEQEIRLMSALIMKCKSIENGAKDLKDLDTISKILERLILAKQRSQTILVEQQRLINADDISRLLDYIESRLVDRIGESETRALLTEFTNYKLN